MGIIEDMAKQVGDDLEQQVLDEMEVHIAQSGPIVPQHNVTFTYRQSICPRCSLVVLLWQTSGQPLRAFCSCGWSGSPDVCHTQQVTARLDKVETPDG